jgi:Galactose oxidase, central domain
MRNPMRIGRLSCPGWRRWAAIVVATLAVVGVPAVSQAGALASPGRAGQAAATSPPPTEAGAMAYDAANRTVVLFRGKETWTWNGSTWTQQHPVTAPPARHNPAMAYDAATGTAVLFGGHGEKCRPRCPLLDDTWTWNGSTWTQQHPATSPPATATASMAYDSATGTAVLFGGAVANGSTVNDTWTWDGSTWTQQHPATSPPARATASMAYDSATGTVVLFGGESSASVLDDTWTWNGSDWAQQQPKTSPPTQAAPAMAYDGATSTVVLFGGGSSLLQNDTWTWNGSNWARQAPRTSPPGREEASMAYDGATSTVVLFGGLGADMALNDTWAWDGATWTEQVPKPGVVGTLNSVTCTGARNCWAVGSPTTGNSSFIYHWNGRSWTVVASQGPPGAISSTLTGVACAQAAVCWAVGDYQNSRADLPYAEHWNGRAWSEVTMPSRATTGPNVSLLDAVACPSATVCFAVGTDEVAGSLIEQWNGASWRIVRDPTLRHSTSTGLYGLSCPSSTDCWAVGGWGDYPNDTGALGDHWDGQQWTAERINRSIARGNGEVLGSISCPAPGMCMATGLSTATNFPYVARWNGSSWKAAPIGAISGSTLHVNGVSCASSKLCEAVGYTTQANAGSLVEQWNGSSWARVPSPNEPNGEGVLDSVACPQATDCWAVGSYNRGELTERFIEHWNGSTWTIAVP